MTVNWSKAESLWLEGKSGQEIADTCGGTRSGVIGHMHRNGIKRSDDVGPSRQASSAIWTDERIAELRRLWISGMGPGEIAETLDVTYRQVSYKANNIGLPARRFIPRPTPEAAPPPPPRPAPPPEADIDPATLKSLLERGSNECAWPIGKPDPRRGQLFCAQPTGFRRSYCECHSTSNGQVLRMVRIGGDQKVRRTPSGRTDRVSDLTELLA